MYWLDHDQYITNYNDTGSDFYRRRDVIFMGGADACTKATNPSFEDQTVPTEKEGAE